eukprot:SAG11_NODE_61_length_19011_cov_49.624048_12_plen_79_part_00
MEGRRSVVDPTCRPASWREDNVGSLERDTISCVRPPSRFKPRIGLGLEIVINIKSSLALHEVLIVFATAAIRLAISPF